AELGVGESALAQPDAIGLEPLAELRDAVGRALGERARRAHDLAPPRQRRLGVGGAAALLTPRALQRAGQLERVLVLGLDDLRADRPPPSLPQPPHGGLRP